MASAINSKSLAEGSAQRAEVFDSVVREVLSFVFLLSLRDILRRRGQTANSAAPVIRGNIVSFIFVSFLLCLLTRIMAFLLRVDSRNRSGKVACDGKKDGVV